MQCFPFFSSKEKEFFRQKHRFEESKNNLIQELRSFKQPLRLCKPGSDKSLYLIDLYEFKMQNARKKRTYSETFIISEETNDEQLIIFGKTANNNNWKVRFTKDEESSQYMANITISK